MALSDKGSRRWSRLRGAARWTAIESPLLAQCDAVSAADPVEIPSQPAGMELSILVKFDDVAAVDVVGEKAPFAAARQNASLPRPLVLRAPARNDRLFCSRLPDRVFLLAAEILR